MLDTALLLVSEVLQESRLDESERLPDLYGQKPGPAQEFKLNVWDGVVLDLLDSGAAFVSDHLQERRVEGPLGNSAFVSGESSFFPSHCVKGKMLSERDAGEQRAGGFSISRNPQQRQDGVVEW